MSLYGVGRGPASPPSAERYSIVTFCPLMKPSVHSPLRKAVSQLLARNERRAEKPRHRTLLRARRERPPDRRATEQRGTPLFEPSCRGDRCACLSETSVPAG